MEKQQLKAPFQKAQCPPQKQQNTAKGFTFLENLG
jgi:hypothetical protein